MNSHEKAQKAQKKEKSHAKPQRHKGDIRRVIGGESTNAWDARPLQ
jgi:hypothetical protein